MYVKINPKRTLAPMAIGVLATIVVAPASAQSPFDKFTEHNAESTRRIDYTPIDDFYKAVSVKSRERQNFRYGILNDQGLDVLDSYIGFFSTIRPSEFSQDEQLAYWLNLRNLLVIRNIAADKPSRSLKKARGDFEGPGKMWTQQRVTVEDVPLSIDDIERRIILAHWNNPNIIYGLYHGVKGGPSFRPPKNFTGAAVHDELSARGVGFVNSRRAVRIKKDEARLPAIFQWYKETLFAGDDSAVLAHVKGHANDKLRTKLEPVTSVEYAAMDYGLDQHIERQQLAPRSSGIGGADSFPSGS